MKSYEELNVDVYCKIMKNENILTCLWSTASSSCKHNKLSDTLQTDLKAAAKELGTDVDTLRNKVQVFVILLNYLLVYFYSMFYNNNIVKLFYLSSALLMP